MRETATHERERAKHEGEAGLSMRGMAQHERERSMRERGKHEREVS